ncbi:MAG TPA: class I SAM-dependent methyltransferase [Polyangiaceae bacterium]|jgi:ubiquinone/menaquinone biosynthesis C-methylase UbiE|nr:class I SAM-dependent methyltransferase [Polyangiaceae bacterium]
MSWLFAKLYDPFMRRCERESLGPWRAELLAGLAGEVTELGAGSGANLPFYPASVSRLTLAEPDAAMRKLLSARQASIAMRAVQPGSVAIVDAPAETLPFADASLDAVVGTLVLCTVRDPLLVLREVRRVLKPGGTYVFLEHGAAEEGSGRLRWQRRLEPAWSRVAEGCHLTRRADEAIASAGFLIETSRRETMRGAWPILRPTVRGVARATPT